MVMEFKSFEYAFGGESLGQDDDERKNMLTEETTTSSSSGSANFQMTFVRRRTSSSDSAQPTLSRPATTCVVGPALASLRWVQLKTWVVVWSVSSTRQGIYDADAPRNQFLRLDVTSSE